MNLYCAGKELSYKVEQDNDGIESWALILTFLSEISVIITVIVLVQYFFLSNTGISIKNNERARNIHIFLWGKLSHGKFSYFFSLCRFDYIL